ncbi:MAG: hypothetical protein AABX11_06980 [Nanoarchaeota archaeon]|mgnify:CR=1 FL=1
MIFNRRGSGPPATAILVLMILALYGITSFLIYQSLNVNTGSIGDSRFADNAYAYKNKVMFYFEVSAREAFVYSYQKVLNEGGDFSELFKRRVSENFGKLDLNDRFVSRFYNLTKDGNYSYELDDSGVSMTYSDMVFQSSFAIQENKFVLMALTSYNELNGNLGIVYRPLIQFSLKYSDMDLLSMDDFIFRVNECGKELNCLRNSFPEFDVSSSNGGEISFESREKYFIDGKLQSIRFKR